jgi:antitoxin YefM
MKTTSYTEFRKRMKQDLDQVNEDHEILIISRKGNKDVVVLSLEDYNAMQETAYLLSSGKNAARLIESIKELEEGKGQEKHLIQ